MSRYVVISPVRNEEEYIRLTLDSVVAQTLRPAQWIIVNDGSTDRTADIVREYMAAHPWICLVELSDRGYYFPGTGVVQVFNQGFAAIAVPDWEFVVKLDVDLSFDPDYFERLIERFHSNPKLGMASGLPLLPLQGGWVPEGVLDDHPVGPSKVYRRACFEQSGGLKPVPGWDLADLLAAQMNGWHTACFKDILLKHYRISGVRRGSTWSRAKLQGSFEYRHGYALHYTILKALHHVRDRESAIGAAARISGYLQAWLTRQPHLFDADMRAFLRAKHAQVLRQRLSGKAAQANPSAATPAAPNAPS